MAWRTNGVVSVLGMVLALVPATISAADPSSDFVQFVVKTIRVNDREFRAAGLEQVRTAAPGAEATKLFAGLLPKLDALGQADLLNALADRGDLAARPAVFEILKSSSEENVRAAAIAALAKLGEPGDLPALITILSGKSGAEQAAVRLAMAQMRGDKVSQALAAELSSVSPPIKATLIDVLANRRASDQVPAILTATLDDNSQVRSAAMSALGLIGRADQLAAMLPGVLKAQKGGERDNAEKNVALVCSRIDNEDERGSRLIAALETIEPAKRDELLSLIGRVGGKKLIDFVGQIAMGSDPARRKLGIDALSKWPDGSTAGKLAEIANKTTDADERKQAFQGYVKVAATRDKRNDRQRLDQMKQAMKSARSDEEKLLVVNRSRTAYDVETLRFVLPYVGEAPFAQMACETIVELAHHREVRDPNKAEFDKALDKVIATSKDAVVIDRANRYKRGETWERPAK